MEKSWRSRTLERLGFSWQNWMALDDLREVRQVTVEAAGTGHGHMKSLSPLRVRRNEKKVVQRWSGWWSTFTMPGYSPQWISWGLTLGSQSSQKTQWVRYYFPNFTDEKYNGPKNLSNFPQAHNKDTVQKLSTVWGVESSWVWFMFIFVSLNHTSSQKTAS